MVLTYFFGSNFNLSRCVLLRLAFRGQPAWISPFVLLFIVSSLIYFVQWLILFFEKIKVSLEAVTVDVPAKKLLGDNTVLPQFYFPESWPSSTLQI